MFWNVVCMWTQLYLQKIRAIWTEWSFRDMISDNIKVSLVHMAYSRFCSNIAVAYRIKLTIHLTVGSAEKSFSKLKLFKNYEWSTMSQTIRWNLPFLSIQKEVVINIGLRGSYQTVCTATSQKSGVPWLYPPVTVSAIIW